MVPKRAYEIGPKIQTPMRFTHSDPSSLTVYTYSQVTVKSANKNVWKKIFWLDLFYTPDLYFGNGPMMRSSSEKSVNVSILQKTQFEYRKEICSGQTLLINDNTFNTWVYDKKPIVATYIAISTRSALVSQLYIIWNARKHVYKVARFMTKQKPLYIIQLFNCASSKQNFASI